MLATGVVVGVSGEDIQEREWCFQGGNLEGLSREEVRWKKKWRLKNALCVTGGVGDTEQGVASGAHARGRQVCWVRGLNTWPKDLRRHQRPSQESVRPATTLTTVWMELEPVRPKEPAPAELVGRDGSRILRSLVQCHCVGPECLWGIQVEGTDGTERS